MYTISAKLAYAGIHGKGYITGGSCSLSAAPPALDSLTHYALLVAYVVKWGVRTTGLQGGNALAGYFVNC